MPEPLRDMDPDKVKELDEKDFRMRLVYDLENIFDYMRTRIEWYMWVMGGVNAVLMLIMISTFSYLLRILS